MMQRVLLLAACLGLFGGVAAAAPKEPTGFGKLTFGMTVDQVRKVFPKMEELALDRNLGISPIGGPYIVRYLLPKQKVAGAPKPVDVELRFWKGKLWFVAVYYGAANDAAVMKELTKAYGPPTGDNAQTAAWTGEKTVIFVEHAQGQYAIQDRSMMREAQEWAIELLRQRGVNVASPPGGAPAAAPAAAAPTPAATPQPTGGSAG